MNIKLGILNQDIQGWVVGGGTSPPPQLASFFKLSKGLRDYGSYGRGKGLIITAAGKNCNCTHMYLCIFDISPIS